MTPREEGAEPGSHAAVIRLWPSRIALAEALGVDVVSVRNWHHRNSIPAERWPAVQRAARSAGLGEIDLESLDGQPDPARVGRDAPRARSSSRRTAIV